MGCYKHEEIGLFGYVYDFSVDYGIASVPVIVSVHNYLMTKNNIV